PKYCLSSLSCGGRGGLTPASCRFARESTCCFSAARVLLPRAPVVRIASRLRLAPWESPPLIASRAAAAAAFASAGTLSTASLAYFGACWLIDGAARPVASPACASTLFSSMLAPRSRPGCGPPVEGGGCGAAAAWSAAIDSIASRVSPWGRYFHGSSTLFEP